MIIQEGELKTVERRNARVDFPAEEGPEIPIVIVFSSFLLVRLCEMVSVVNCVSSGE